MGWDVGWRGRFSMIINATGERFVPLKSFPRGVMPLYAVSLIHKETLQNIPDFEKVEVV